MSRRERPAPRLADPARKLVRSSASAPIRDTTGRSPAALDWETLFHGVTTVQREELIKLAQSQGLLYSYQLPAMPNGTCPEHGPEVLIQMLRGQLDKLAPVPAEPIKFADGDLDNVQREAVARALQTPDICLIQGYPGTGKSRVIAEIVTQAAAAGRRVLLAAPTTAALDRVLELLTTRDHICALRCLGSGETVASLRPGVRPFTLAAQEQMLRTRAFESAGARIEASTRKHSRLKQLEASWPKLADLAREHSLLQEQQEAIARRQTRLPEEVEAEATGQRPSTTCPSLSPTLRERAQARDAILQHAGLAIAELREQLKALARQSEEVCVRRARVEPLVRARQAWRLWSHVWWQALLYKGLDEEWNDIQTRSQRLKEDTDKAQADLDTLERKRDLALASFEAERTELIQAELGRRQQALVEELGRISSAANSLAAKGQVLVAGIAQETDAPSGFTPAAIGAAKEKWRILVDQTAQEAALAREWADYLGRAPEAIAAQLPRYVNVLAATLAGPEAFKHFGEAGANGSGVPIDFDYLILDEADQVAEADLLKVARRARRWILVGQPVLTSGIEKAQESLPEQGAKRSDFVRPATGSAAGTTTARPFYRLWQHLHCAPRALPYRWVTENDRICCQFRAVAREHFPLVEIERVADSPDIELHILTLPQSKPTLVGIVFPPSLPIAAAKQFVYSELQELAIESAAHACRWLEQAGRLTVLFAQQPAGEAQSVPIEPGITEYFVAINAGRNGQGTSRTVWHTDRIEFDSMAGWDRQRAAQWLAQRAGLHDLGRTSFLDAVHRSQPALRAFLAGIFDYACSTATPPTRAGGPDCISTSVEFVSVPPINDHHASLSNRDGQPALSPFSTNHKSLRGGAGLELDLADPRQRDRLPVELRGVLPKQGIVNYLEAQTIVQALGAFGSQGDGALSGGVLDGRNHAYATVAVLSLFPAQAELIRRLADRAPFLANIPFQVEIGVVDDFGQREADLVLVSLTRSHTHRAVAFCHDPRVLALALTRARSRLLLFGDVGTLLRRSDWDGPLEDLDALAAEKEKQLLARLVLHLDGLGRGGPAQQLRRDRGS